MENNFRKKTFRDYYADPEYRKKHVAHIMVKVPCPGCGIITARCNMSKHKKTNKHAQIIGLIEKYKYKST